MSTYCAGTNCSKRDNCALHCIAPGVYDYLDWSRHGRGSCGNNLDGTPYCNIEYSCGDLGNFKKFKEVKGKIK